MYGFFDSAMFGALCSPYGSWIASQMKNVIIFGIVVILLQLLRNVSSMYYLTFAAYLIIVLLYDVKFARHKNFQGYVAIFFGLMMYVLLMTLAAPPNDGQDWILGYVRLFYLIPIILFFVFAPLNNRDASRLWIIFLIFALASSLSIVVQYVIGPIDWFADASSRAGTERFASLAGSLTIFGSLLGPAVFITFYKVNNALLRGLVLCVLTIGALMSLQKMSLVYGGGAALVSLMLIRKFSWRGIAATCIIILCIVGGFLVLRATLPAQFTDHVNYAMGQFGEKGDATDDVSIGHSIVQRMTEKPAALLEYWGPLQVAVGVGVWGGAGGLGNDKLPMAHNQVVETVAIFGLFITILILLWLFRYFGFAVRLIYRNADNRQVLAALVFTTSVIAALFTGSLFYHPVIGSLFWFSYGELHRYKFTVQTSGVATVLPRAINHDLSLMK